MIETASFDGAEVGERATPNARAANATRGAARPVAPGSRGLRLLDVDPRLGERLDGAQRASAHERVILPTIAAALGPWDPQCLADADGVLGDVCGFMLVDGAALMSVGLAGRSCVRLVGAGDIVLIGDDGPARIAVQQSWHIRSPAQFLVFDQRLGSIAQYWPRLFSAILSRAAQHADLAFRQQAISQLPRVDERLLALLWTLAERYGTVVAGGVHVELDLSHETLAHMIGARRPTVSLGMNRLINAKMVSIAKGGYLLHPDSLKLLTPSARPR